MGKLVDFNRGECSVALSARPDPAPARHSPTPPLSPTIWWQNSGGGRLGEGRLREDRLVILRHRRGVGGVAR